MILAPFDRKTAKPGDKLILKTAPSIRMVYRGLGFDGDVIVRVYHNSQGLSPRDRILTPAQQLMLEVEQN